MLARNEAQRLIALAPEHVHEVPTPDGPALLVNLAGAYADPVLPALAEALGLDIRELAGVVSVRVLLED